MNGKKVVFISLLLVGTSTFAQHIIGLELSYKRSTFRYDEVVGSPFATAGRMGLGLNYQVYIGEVLSTATHFKTGIAYEGKGSARKVTQIDQNGTNIRELKLQNALYYWTLPLMLEMHSTSGRFYVEYGGYFSYLTESYWSEYPLARYQSVDGGIKWMKPYQPGAFKKYDAGINLGFGTVLPLSSRSGMKFGFRYSHGLVNVNDDPLYTESPIYNRAFVVNVSVNWAL